MSGAPRRGAARRGHRRGGDPDASPAGSARSRCCRRWRRCAPAATRSSSGLLAENAGRWEGLTERDRERVEALARAVVNRLLHEPTVRVKGLEAEQRHARLQLLRELFGLEEAAAEGAEPRPRPPRSARCARVDRRCGSAPAAACSRSPRRAPWRDGARRRDRARRDHHGRRRRPRARRQVALDRRAGGGAAGRRHRPRGALGQGRAGRAAPRARRSSPRRAAPTRSTCWSASARSTHVREGARVGTSALRRRAQLLAARPDLEVVELRGNVDTRLRKLRRGRGRRARARRRRARPARTAATRPAARSTASVFVPAAGPGRDRVQARTGTPRRRCRRRRVPCGHDGVPAGGTGRDPGARRELSRPRRRFAHGSTQSRCTSRGFAGLPDGSAVGARRARGAGRAARGRRPRARAADARGAARATCCASAEAMARVSRDRPPRRRRARRPGPADRARRRADRAPPT